MNPSPRPTNEAPTARTDVLLCLLLVVVLGVLYALCWSGCWVPGGSDDAFYLDIARNLAHGRGFVANDAPVVIAPPGWPLVLAGAMRLSPSFAWLNLLPMTFLLAASAAWYLILRRFASPWTAFTVMLVVGTLFQWQRLSFHLYTDALFCLLLSVSLLLALQISERRRAGLRIPALLALCALMVTVRWAGVAAWFPLAGALLCGERRPRLNRRWLTALLAGILIAGTFIGVRTGLLASIRRQHEQAATPQERTRAQDALDQDARRMNAIFNVEKTRSLATVITTGNWLTRMLWPPAELAILSRPAAVATSILGWLLLGLFALRLWQGFRAREYLMIGALLYYAALSFGWSAPSCRHLVPVTPLLVLGLWQGFEILRAKAKAKTLRRLAVITALVITGSVVLCNLSILGMNVRIIRSKDFVRRWQAGEYAQLLAVANRLKDAVPLDGELAVNADFSNLNRGFSHRYVTRMTALVTDRPVRIVPRSICRQRPDEQLLAWCEQENISYYVYRPGVNPWRLWHFRMPRLQEIITGEAPGDETPYFELYRIVDGRFVALALDEIDDGLRRAPGFE